ncbi:hypothetical protein AX17_003159 [Amanita inopinata Kibby_2008]|nr:hypothetical protein AX17_003159 [Amanita inopinata Kibby_2008]
MSASTAALRAVKKFRLHEFKGLQEHILRFGPLPPSQVASNASPAIRLPNPFVPRKNPKTGKWIEPKYSLRRQAELVKKAKAAGLLHLLPPGSKNPQLSADIRTGATPASSQSAIEPAKGGAAVQISQECEKTEEDGPLQEMWAAHVDWEGSRKHMPVAGAEIGARLYAARKRMFKGHKWERVKQKRETRKRILLRDMDRRVFNYKNYYKRRRPHPLKPPRTAKAAKLPF